jgi:hypothetical protein
VRLSTARRTLARGMGAAALLGTLRGASPVPTTMLRECARLRTTILADPHGVWMQPPPPMIHAARSPPDGGDEWGVLDKVLA